MKAIFEYQIYLIQNSTKIVERFQTVIWLNTNHQTSAFVKMQSTWQRTSK